MSKQKQPITKDKRKTTKKDRDSHQKSMQYIKVILWSKNELEIIRKNLRKEAGSLRHWDATKTYDYQLKIKIKGGCIRTCTSQRF